MTKKGNETMSSTDQEPMRGENEPEYTETVAPTVTPTGNLSSSQKNDELNVIVRLFMGGNPEVAKTRYTEYLRKNDRKFRTYLSKKLIDFVPGEDLPALIKTATDEYLANG